MLSRLLSLCCSPAASHSAGDKHGDGGLPCGHHRDMPFCQTWQNTVRVRVLFLEVRMWGLGFNLLRERRLWFELPKSPSPHSQTHTHAHLSTILVVQSQPLACPGSLWQRRALGRARHWTGQEWGGAEGALGCSRERLGASPRSDLLALPCQPDV